MRRRGRREIKNKENRETVEEGREKGRRKGRRGGGRGYQEAGEGRVGAPEKHISLVLGSS